MNDRLTVGMGYITLPALLPIVTYMWFMFAFFNFYLFQYFDFFFTKAAYLLTPAGVSAVVCLPV